LVACSVRNWAAAYHPIIHGYSAGRRLPLANCMGTGSRVVRRCIAVVVLGETTLAAAALSERVGTRWTRPSHPETVHWRNRSAAWISSAQRCAAPMRYRCCSLNAGSCA